MDASESLTPAIGPTPSNKRGLIILALDIILLVILLKFLPYGEKANVGLALMVFVGVLWLTEAIHVTITALCIPILAVGMGLMNTGDALKSFANPIIFLFFGGFALATALHIQGLDRLIANRLLMIARGRLSVAVLLIFGITALLSMWISNTATAAMMLPLILGVLANLDVRTERNTFVFVLLGVAYSASIGGLGTLVGSPPNAIAAAQLGMDFFTWMKYGVPMVIVLMPVMVGVMYLMLRPNLKHKFDLELEHLKWNGKRVTTMGIFLLTVVCWISSSFISDALGGVKDLDTIIAVSAAILIGITGVSTWSQIQNNTEWGVLMLFGGGLTLSAVLKNSGASEVMANGMAATFGSSPWFVIIVAIAAFIIFLTEFTSNTASAALLVPIFATVAEALGMPIVVLTMIIGIGASCAFMLPVATPPNAIVYGTGYIKQVEMVRVGIVLNLVCIAIISAIAWFFWL
ncbi:SLC13 family permease [Xenorhabdus griffiniae]|uniref:DASS family sodium-coupled anion symporter n=1 Tax=Xenorhabdus griffiniae TaxID=351672 RepID=A0ABY9XKA1_9GAMM|nr:DASS family sodium-coupled anion symporter [Xenorhabdus griffiniae]MBD1226614.1 DASS family sodium-coupled anion symporter [Xenorhabdus griffiniae]MBE8588078.1 DASS family sodium-coupled anion symporter [Xenorhabdus griffiniae]WMV73255.1 DASS family sodium-coupled anion symporter [Xenorhabdus griffiniae]WNH02934.1 DASS family sodium-coupled anion symporter [Xenorhabdus griffiniae]